MDKESSNSEGDVNIAIAKEPKDRIEYPSKHKNKISKALKEVSSLRLLF